MFAIAAFICFALGLILRLLSSAPAKDVTALTIAGLGFVALHLAWPLFPRNRDRP